MPYPPRLGNVARQGSHLKGMLPQCGSSVETMFGIISDGISLGEI